VVSNWGDALAARTLASTRSSCERYSLVFVGSFAGGEPGRLAGGLRDVIANTLTTTPPMRTSWTQTKALGDTADDLVYTPVVPCRIVDSRNAGGAVRARGDAQLSRPSDQRHLCQPGRRGEQLRDSSQSWRGGDSISRS
jgi:hypothetical protein